ncbi:MAG TPA: hypothetical protein EYQ00_15780 [Dehalococcoidia bacterium]|nr:hypothetical protein [Dehalococcoidia bacterium]
MTNVKQELIENRKSLIQALNQGTDYHVELRLSELAERQHQGFNSQEDTLETGGEIHMFKEALAVAVADAHEARTDEMIHEIADAYNLRIARINRYLSQSAIH